MWCLLWAGVVHAAEPSVDRLQRTALQTRRSESSRMHAIIALGELGTPESEWALSEILDQLEPDSELARVATAAVVQNADLAELARHAWPEWAHAYVTSRIDELLPQHCEDDDVASLPLKERRVLDAVDGDRTVRAIVAASNLSSFDACRILVQFLEARVLRRRAA